MNVGHPTIGFDIATCRRDDILRQAEVNRLLSEVPDNRPTVGAVRRQVGNALIRFGERLQGSLQHRLGQEFGDASGALHLAR
jgi:hypothetical protein